MNLGHSLFLSCLCLLLILIAGFDSRAQQQIPQSAKVSAVLNAQPPPMDPTPAAIIQNFIEAEIKFREAVMQFSFKREVLLQTIGSRGEVTGEYFRLSAFVIDDRGQRVERVLDHPKPNLKNLIITKEDIQDLAGSQLFGLEITDLKSYNLSYFGREFVNGQPLYLIGVGPTRTPDPRYMKTRFFLGVFGIDPVTYRPVYVEGTTEPHGKQRFPNFRTERQIENAGVLFPSLTTADDILLFPHSQVHYRIKIKYYDFKRFAARVKIVEVD